MRSPPPAQPARVDCLACHAAPDLYSKLENAAGNPPLSPVPAGAKTITGARAVAVDLAKAAQSVAMPRRENCGQCHFYGGGGDNAKHGNLSSALVSPARSTDVHMAADGLKFACQTWHIPEFARSGVATKTFWDWSAAGKLKDGKPYAEEGFTQSDGKHLHTYLSTKGDFEWGENVVPFYAWVDGQVDCTTGDRTIDPSKVVEINRIEGSSRADWFWQCARHPPASKAAPGARPGGICSSPARLSVALGARVRSALRLQLRAR